MRLHADWTARIVDRLKPESDFSPDMSTLSRWRGSLSRLPVAPDIIHLHSTAAFLSAYEIMALWRRFRAPIVWTISDMAPFTGGCHYSGGCTRFTDRCGRCPLLRSDSDHDVSRRAWLAKKRWLDGIPITMTGSSQWAIDTASRSSLFAGISKVRVPAGIDESIFRPRNPPGIRKLLGLPTEVRVIFFGATNHRDPRKGMAHLIESLHLHPSLLPPGTHLVALTVGDGDDYGSSLPFPCVAMGRMANDRRLAMLYQAADLFISSSTEDVGPLMIPEALMCGTPVVAFDGCGVAADLIRFGINGYLAQMRSAPDLAYGISAVLQQTQSGTVTAESCRHSVLPEWSMRRQGERYRLLYRELLSTAKAAAGAAGC